ncbi:MAG TPA: long-chain fatty acid--CoA ligase [Bacteroidales bacterium]|nr:long-chain fatty acid--CoA ligase [Bacteroidales bacterium]
MINIQYKDKIALITKNESYTYQQFFAKVNQFSKLFEGKSYQKIAIHAENREDWVFAFYAGWKNNCIVVPIDFLSSVDDVSYILNDCVPELIFISSETAPKIDRILSKLSYKPQIINFDEFKIESDDSEFKWNVPKDKEDTAVIIYTSGTTGSPKGVELSYKNLLANIDAVTEKVKIFTKERQTLLLLPLHHIFPLAGSMLAPLAVGGTIVMAPSMQSSDLLETLKNNKVNIMIGVPRLYDLLYKGLKTKIYASGVGKIVFNIVKALHSKKVAKKLLKKVHDGLGGHLEILVAGGAALNKETGSFFKALGFEVLEGYGMTEASPMITFTRPGKMRIGSPGHTLPGLLVEIRDNEICAKGDNIMKGYYNRPEETADVIKDGWLYTGDLGRFDKDGFLHITGRKKEIIVLQNGKNINPVELEEKLEKLEYIKEAGVFVKNDKLHAVISPDYEILSKNEIKDPQGFFKKELMPDFNKELTSYKRIMKYSLINQEIPRTRLGKIQRFKLEELFESPVKEAKNAEDLPVSEEYVVIRTFIESQVDMTISPEDNLEFDIALDSLGKITLIDFIERTFGVKIEEENLFKFPSVRNMVDHIREHKIFHNLEMPNWSEILKEKIQLKLPKSWPTLPFFIKSSRNFLKIYFRFKSKGHNDLPEGPAIITPNHQSFFDALFVTAHLKRKTIKETYFYAKRKHVKTKLFRFLAGKNNIIVMDLNNDLKESIQKMAAVLKSGKKIMIFPEGTRSKNGELGEFKKTFAILSKELNVPIIPVAITGAYKALPVGSKFPRPFTKVRVKYLEAIYPEDHTFETLIEKVKASIKDAV